MRAAVASIIVIAISATSPLASPHDTVRDLVESTLPDGASRGADALASNAIVVSIRGAVQNKLDDRFLGPFVNLITEPKFNLSSLKITLDPTGFAWFYGIIDVALDRNSKTSPHVPVRVSGIAVAAMVGGLDAWKLAAIMYAGPVDDAKLVTIAEQQKTTPATNPPTLVHANAVEREVARWLSTGHLADARAATPDVWAAGTAPAELGTGRDAATKLAASWDKLHLGATKIEARLYENGSVGFVAATVMLPLGHGRAAELGLGAIVVREGSQYRWLTLSFTPTSDVHIGPPPPP